MDVDAGPVIAGHGVSASAFGTGAARKNGRFDRAYPLSAEMLATVWELPNGTLAMPRILSNLSDAPLLGEAAILWLLSIQPQKGFAVIPGKETPTYVYAVLITAFCLGMFLVVEGGVRFQAARREPEPVVPAPGFQAFIWCVLFAGAVGLFFTPWSLACLPLILLMLLVPRRGKKRPKDDWDKQQNASSTTTAPKPG